MGGSPQDPGLPLPEMPAQDPEPKPGEEPPASEPSNQPEEEAPVSEPSGQPDEEPTAGQTSPSIDQPLGAPQPNQQARLDMAAKLKEQYERLQRLHEALQPEESEAMRRLRQRLGDYMSRIRAHESAVMGQPNQDDPLVDAPPINALEQGYFDEILESVEPWGDAQHDLIDVLRRLAQIERQYFRGEIDGGEFNRQQQEALARPNELFQTGPPPRDEWYEQKEREEQAKARAAAEKRREQTYQRYREILQRYETELQSVIDSVRDENKIDSVSDERKAGFYDSARRMTAARNLLEESYKAGKPPRADSVLRAAQTLYGAHHFKRHLELHWLRYRPGGWGEHMSAENYGISLEDARARMKKDIEEFIETATTKANELVPIRNRLLRDLRALYDYHATADEETTAKSFEDGARQLCGTIRFPSAAIGGYWMYPIFVSHHVRPFCTQEELNAAGFGPYVDAVNGGGPWLRYVRSNEPGFDELWTRADVGQDGTPSLPENPFPFPFPFDPIPLANPSEGESVSPPHDAPAPRGPNEDQAPVDDEKLLGEAFLSIFGDDSEEESREKIREILEIERLRRAREAQQQAAALASERRHRAEEAASERRRRAEEAMDRERARDDLRQQLLTRASQIEPGLAAEFEADLDDALEWYLPFFYAISWVTDTGDVALEQAEHVRQVLRKQAKAGAKLVAIQEFRRERGKLTPDERHVLGSLERSTRDSMSGNADLMHAHDEATNQALFNDLTLSVVGGGAGPAHRAVAGRIVARRAARQAAGRLSQGAGSANSRLGTSSFQGGSSSLARRSPSRVSGSGTSSSASASSGSGASSGTGSSTWSVTERMGSRTEIDLQAVYDARVREWLRQNGFKDPDIGDSIVMPRFARPDRVGSLSRHLSDAEIRELFRPGANLTREQLLQKADWFLDGRLRRTGPRDAGRVEPIQRTPRRGGSDWSDADTIIE